MGNFQSQSRGYYAQICGHGEKDPKGTDLEKACQNSPLDRVGNLRDEDVQGQNVDAYRLPYGNEEKSEIV